MYCPEIDFYVINLIDIVTERLLDARLQRFVLLNYRYTQPERETTMSMNHTHIHTLEAFNYFHTFQGYAEDFFRTLMPWKL